MEFCTLVPGRTRFQLYRLISEVGVNVTPGNAGKSLLGSVLNLRPYSRKTATIARLRGHFSRQLTPNIRVLFVIPRNGRSGFGVEFPACFPQVVEFGWFGKSITPVRVFLGPPCNAVYSLAFWSELIIIFTFSSSQSLTH